MKATDPHLAQKHRPPLVPDAAASQAELPLSSVSHHAIWPGRRVVRIAEVAKEMRCSEQHVVNLIECGRLVAVNIATGLPVVPVRPGLDAKTEGKIPRACLRIPVSAYDAFIKESSSLSEANAARKSSEAIS